MTSRSPTHIRSFPTNIYLKLNANNRRQAVAIVSTLGILSSR